MTKFYTVELESNFHQPKITSWAYKDAENAKRKVAELNDELKKMFGIQEDEKITENTRIKNVYGFDVGDYFNERCVLGEKTHYEYDEDTQTEQEYTYQEEGWHGASIGEWGGIFRRGVGWSYLTLFGDNQWVKIISRAYETED